MRVVLDTHIVIHAANDALDTERTQLLADRRAELFLSAVTLWEITKLVELGYLAMPDGFDRFMRTLCAHPRYTIAQYDAALMIELLGVSKRMHRDPADQIIVATARRLGASLMTDDKLIRRADLVPVC